MTSDSFVEHNVKRSHLHTYPTVQYSTGTVRYTTVRTVVHPVLPYNVVINHIVQVALTGTGLLYCKSIQSICFRDQSNLCFKNALFQNNPVYELSGNPDYNYEEGGAEK
jgi:hypothetical protein